MYRHLLIFLVVVLTGIATAVAEDGDGGYAAAYLQVPIGARPAGMGGAFIAVSDDGAAVLYNPAGLATLQKPMFSTSYRAMTLDRTLGYVGLVFPTRAQSALGFNWLYAGSGSVAARNNDGDLMGFDITQHSHSISVVFAKRFEDFLAVGFRGAYGHQVFAELSAFTVSFDLSAMFYFSHLMSRDDRERATIQDIQAGLVVRNLAAYYRWNNEDYLNQYVGSDVPSVNQKDNVPVEVGIGGSARFLKRKLLLASDLAKNVEQAFTFHGGAEYFVTPQFALRGGYSDGSFTAGTGYVFKFGETVLAVDYAFSSEKVEEGSEHIFSFDLLF